MTTQEAIEYYGGPKYLANALDIYPQAIYAWGERPPKAKQFELYVISGRKLKIDERYYQETTDAQE